MHRWSQLWVCSWVSASSAFSSSRFFASAASRSRSPARPPACGRGERLQQLPAGLALCALPQFLAPASARLHAVFLCRKLESRAPHDRLRSDSRAGLRRFPVFAAPSLFSLLRPSPFSVLAALSCSWAIAAANSPQLSSTPSSWRFAPRAAPPPAASPFSCVRATGGSLFFSWGGRMIRLRLCPRSSRPSPRARGPPSHRRRPRLCHGGASPLLSRLIRFGCSFR